MKSNTKSESSDASPLVLVIDDSEDNRTMYVEYLRLEGFRVAEAQNGQEAVEDAVELRPDLVVMDLTLPIMDGWEATRRLKADPRTSRIPVIALSGHEPEAFSQRAKEAGCASFLAKPCLPDVLAREVKQLLSLQREGGTNEGK
jgi:two-component system cell cycle response regulator DivK